MRTPETEHNLALRRELHALAQPMAILQCRLELGLMSGDEEALREALRGGLGDLRRMTESLQNLRETVAAAGGEEPR